jgi:DNA polymerase III epsilon subunit-like protein
MQNIMVDIETLGNVRNSAVLSIGAVQFSMGSDRAIGEEFYVNIDVASSIRFGCKVESATFYWWMRQGDEARRALFNPVPVEFTDALSAFRDFIGHDNPLVWAKPPGFDLGHLTSCYQLVEQPIPWHHRNERDVRTFCDVVQRLGWNPPNIKSKTKHNALADAKAQVWTVHSADKFGEELLKCRT